MKIDDIAKQLANKVNQEHYIKHYLEKVQRGAYNKGVKDTEAKQLILSGVVKSLPTKEEINLAANECSDINEIICEDEYWVIAKNDGFQEGADFVINKLK